ncbi:MAG: CaiB/BaiF CoA transferase family protein [Oscillospiraceae bacterium]
MNNGALAGIRVADFGMVWAGPICGTTLSFLGADVIKIESHKHVDQTRQGSITTGDDFDGVNHSPIFNNANLNKKSVSIDISSPEGAELARQIVSKCDVVIENMRPGKMHKNGLGYEDLVKVKPDIIMVSSSGFGATGPYHNYGGYAPIFASIGGLAYLTGYSDTEPNTGSGVMDLRVGTMAALAILAALIHRQKTGEGQYIDLSSSECIMSMIGSELLTYTMNGVSPMRCGNDDQIMAPHNVYRCKGDDKWVSIAVATDEEWKALCGAMGDPTWAKDPKYADTYSRWENRAELDKAISEWTIGYTDYEVMEMLQKVGVAAMPSMSAEEILNDPHSKARDLFMTVDHPKMGTKTVERPPWLMTETSPSIRKASPLLGEDNDEIFGGLLGMSKEEIADLVEKKIIF